MCAMDCGRGYTKLDGSLECGRNQGRYREREMCGGMCGRTDTILVAEANGPSGGAGEPARKQAEYEYGEKSVEETTPQLRCDTQRTHAVYSLSWYVIY